MIEISRRHVATCLTMLLLPGIRSRPLSAQTGTNLIEPMPAGVTFTPWASAPGTPFAHHVDGMSLHRFRLDCGQVTPLLFGMEQITYIEYGEALAYDAERREPIATLKAGDTLGPSEQDGSFYLVPTDGHSATVLHARFGDSTPMADHELPADPEPRTCQSGASTEVEVSTADVDVLLHDTMDVETAPDRDPVYVVGLLDVAPGAGVGDADNAAPSMFTVQQGGMILLPIVGGFGSGEVGTMGAGTTELPPMTAGAFATGAQLALVNHGSTPTQAIVFAATRADSPLLIQE